MLGIRKINFRPSLKLSLSAYVFFLGYFFLLLFFNVIDVYHHQFFSTGLIVIFYNLARLLFIAYLMWLFYIVGEWTLSLLAGQAYRKLPLLSALLLAFFAGVGVFHIILLFIGFAGLYHRGLMAILTSIIIIASLPRFDELIKYAAEKPSFINWTGIAILLPPLVIFLITKGLYPAGGHDYYNHYFHFYRAVTESGSIMPNNVWYHFYYSKGAALFFLSMLLTDPLAPQLASTALILAGAAIVFSIVNLKTTWRLLPWIAAALYLALLIYTPGPVENLHLGGWGDLEKPHEPAAVILLAALWIVSQSIRTPSHRVWGCGLLLSMSALVLISPMTSVFAIIFLCIMTFIFFIQGKKQISLWLFGSAVVAIGCLIFLFGINYLITGIPEDQNLLKYWPIVNFNKVREWGVLFEVLMLHWGREGLVVNQIPLNTDFILRVLSYLRFDVWGLVMICVLAFTAFSLCIRKWRSAIFSKLDKPSLFILGSFLLLVAVLSIFIGRDQPTSYYRFTSFTYAPTLCFCILLLSPLLHSRMIRTAFSISLVVITLSLIELLYFANQAAPLLSEKIHMVIGQYHSRPIISVAQNSFRFITGRYSLADAYRNQQGWPGRLEWGGIYPAAEKIWQQLPPHTRIWSMHIHSYCMLPDCHMEGFGSFRFSPHANIIIDGDPSIAKMWLKKENLNYFLISHSLKLTDPLPLSPLFSPTNIANYLGIVWTDGDNSLLTWKEQARFSIDSAWLEKYKEHITQSLLSKSFPYNDMRTIIENGFNPPSKR